MGHAISECSYGRVVITHSSGLRIVMHIANLVHVLISEILLRGDLEAGASG